MKSQLLTYLAPMFVTNTRNNAYSGTFYCDQGDIGITQSFAIDVINQIDLNSIFGVPGNSYKYFEGCLSTSQTGNQYCCQVAYLSSDGVEGTVTMTANGDSTGADAGGGIDTGYDIYGIASGIFRQCWTNNNDLHSGRWAGTGEYGGNFQIGLSGGTC